MDDSCIITLSPNATGPFIFKGDISDQNELFRRCNTCRIFDVDALFSVVFSPESYVYYVFLLFKRNNEWFLIKECDPDAEGIDIDVDENYNHVESVSLLDMRNKIHDSDFMNAYGFTDKPEEFLSVIDQLENGH